MKETLNILAINWQDITNPLGGGAEVHFHEIFRRVADKGHKVTLLCCEHKGAPKEEVIDGIHIVRHGSRNAFNFSVPRAHKRLDKENSYDIVVDDINKIPFYTPLFVKKPILAIVHHLFGKSIFLEASFLPASYVYYSELLIPSIYKKTPFAVVSKSTEHELVAKGIKSPIHLLPNAVDLSIYHNDNKKLDKPVIGYLGRLKKYKSVEHFIQAIPLVLKEIPDASFIIVGDGDHLPVLKNLANQLGISDKINFTGHVSMDEKVHLLNQMSLVVNPSPKEGWGLTVIEANACGVPVIAADSPGLRDSVLHQKTGLLYPYGNINMLAEHIITLCINESQRYKFVQESLEWAHTFDWNNSADKAIEIMKKTIHDYGDK